MSLNDSTTKLPFLTPTMRRRPEPITVAVSSANNVQFRSDMVVSEATPTPKSTMDFASPVSSKMSKARSSFFEHNDDEDASPVGGSTPVYTPASGTFHLTDIVSSISKFKRKVRAKKVVGWNVTEVVITKDGPLPFQIKHAALVDNLQKNMRITDPYMRSLFETHFMSDLNKTILENSFWFIFTIFFQENSAVGERFIEEMAINTAKLSMKIQRFDRDAFFELYHIGVSYCILKAMSKHFSASKKKFTSNFKVRVYEIVCELFLGIRYKRDYIQKQRIKYFPRKSEDNFLEKLMMKQSKKSMSTSRSHNSTNHTLQTPSRSEQTNRSKTSVGDYTSLSKTSMVPRSESPGGEFYSASEEEEEQDEMEEFDKTSSKPETVSDAIQKLGLDENYHFLPPEVLEQEVEEIENMRKKMRMANKGSNSETSADTKIKKSMSPRLQNADYVTFLSGDSDKLKEKYWYTLSMSPLVMRAMKKVPPEFSLNYSTPELGKNVVRLIKKDGFSQPTFFGSLNDPKKLLSNIKKYHKVWNPESTSEIKISTMRQNLSKEMNQRNNREAKRDIHWIKSSTRAELTQIEKEKKDLIKNKANITQLCEQLVKKSEEEATSKTEIRYQTVESHNFKGSAFAGVVFENTTKLEKKLNKLQKLLNNTSEICFITKEEHKREEADLSCDLDSRDPPKALNVSLLDYIV